MKKDGRGRVSSIPRRIEPAQLSGVGGKLQGKKADRPTDDVAKTGLREVGGEAPFPVNDIMMAQSIDNGDRYTHRKEGHANY